MKPYSLDLRLKVLDAVDCGIPKEELVGIFGVSMSTIDRYLRQRRQTGEIAPGRTPRRTPLICATIEERRSLWRQLEENDAATLERHCELWESKQRVRISVSTMCRPCASWVGRRDRVTGSLRTRRRERRCLARAHESSLHELVSRSLKVLGRGNADFRESPECELRL